MEQKIKIVRKSGFTHIPNPPLRDQALTLQSKGLFCMMLSLPEGWDFTVGGLATVCGCGRDKIRACLRNLEAAGYLLREQGHGSDGQFAGNVYVLYDEKCAPLPGFPSTGKPSTENPLTENPTEYKKDVMQERNNTPLTPQGGRRAKRAEWEPERFEGLWRYYPVIQKPDGSSTSKGDKGDARRAWNALRPSPELIRDMGRWLRPKLRYDEQYARGYGVKTVSVWLNGIRRNGGVLEMPEAPQAAQVSGADGGTVRTVERPGDYEI